MPGFSRRPLAVFVCCLFAGVQSAHAVADIGRVAAATDTSAHVAAENAANGLGLGEMPLNLRQERKFNVLGKAKQKVAGSVVGLENPVVLKKDDSYPLFIVASRIEGQNDEVVEAEGDVELRRAGSLLFADKATYRTLEDEVEATGNVRFLQDGAEVSGPHLRIKLTEQIGAMENATYSILRDAPSRFYGPKKLVTRVASNNLNTSGVPMMLTVADSYGLPTQAPPRQIEVNGQAERIDFEGENHYTLVDSSYSTCKPEQTDWYLKTSETKLDFDRKEGEAKNATLWFGNTPIFYSPTISFPLSGQPRSGVLYPNYSTSTRSGLDFTLPYYWNIAPNYDLTLFPRYMSKRGFQLGAEARYLEHNFQGNIRLEYLPNDEMKDRSRYAYRIEHQHDLGRDVSAQIDWNGVSDDFYWQDMSSRLLRTSQAQLRRQLQLTYAPSPWLQGSIQVLRHQTLQLDPSIKRPYFIEPQLNIVGYKPDVLKMDFSMIGQYSRFTHADLGKDQGDRFVFYPQLSLPIVNPAFQITPKLGLHISQYSLDRATAGLPDTISRTLPTFTLDSSMVFERDVEWFGKGHIQTLEPRLYYVNIPYRDQSNIPLFDTALADFNFAQIFSENRYSGYDRINDANQLTLALTTRLLSSESGAEQFKAMIGQRYYFKPQRVAITGETTRQDDFSNLVAAVNGLVAPKTYMDVAWEYNYSERTSDRFSAGVRFQPDLGKVLSASYRHTRDPLKMTSTVDQIDIAGQWPLSAQWYGIGRYNYSLRDSRVLETIAGVEYNAGCWAVRVVGQRLAAISGTPNDTLFFQLELNDFGSIGTNPIGLLRRSIPGYGKINELPTDGNLLTSQ
jgi:LPS-assembly protein